MSDGPQLATFLRARRERVAPTDVGLPAGRRRRTPGLRREELAMLAGISVDYLVRLEQGRETSPSAAVVVALADALRLDGDERRHMWSLAAASTHTEMCPTVAPPAGGLSRPTQELLDRLTTTPAFVMDRLTDVVAWNAAYEALMRPTGVLDLEPPNLLRYTFLEPASRATFPDWSAVAREQVGNLRAATAGCVHDDPLASLVGELNMRSPEFTRLWAAHDVGVKRRGVKRLRHPVVGELTVEFEALGLPDGADRQLVTYLAADESSETALDRLFAPPAAAGHPPHLRVVDAGA